MAGRTFGWLGLWALMTASAMADGTGDAARRGWYVGGGATYAVEQFSTGSGLDIANSPGVRVQGGYRAHPRFGAEMDVDYLTGFGVHGGLGTSHVQGVAPTLNGKGYLATGRIQPYGVAGVGGLYVSGVDSSLHNILGLHGGVLTRFGGGVDLYATNHVVLNAEATYDLPTGDVGRLRFVPMNLGAQYRF